MADPVNYNPEETIRVDKASDTITYVGWARPGSATADALWAITRVSFDVNGVVTAQEWADGTGNYDNVWDDRAGLSYS